MRGQEALLGDGEKMEEAEERRASLPGEVPAGRAIESLFPAGREPGLQNKWSDSCPLNSEGPAEVQPPLLN